MASDTSHQTKFYRSQEHLEQLKTRIEAWGERRSYSTHLEPNPNDPQNFILYASADPISDEEFSPLIGDVVQNLRASLDHLVVAMSVREQKRELTDEEAQFTQFPVFWDDERSKGSKTFDKTKKSSLRFVSEGAHAAIKRLQPFSVTREAGGDARDSDSFLWKLHQLSNLDKHRSLRLVGVVPKQFKLTGDSELVVRANWFVNVPVERDTPIAFFYLRPGFNYRNVDVGVEATLDIAFRDAPVSGEPALQLLAEISHWVARGIIKPLEDEFLL